MASITFTDDGIVVELRRRFRRLTCPVCGWSTRAGYDSSRRRWRHIDAGSSKIWLAGEIRRLDCRPCGRVVTGQVPWAWEGACHSLDLQDVIVLRASPSGWRAVSWASDARAATPGGADPVSQRDFDDAHLINAIIDIHVDDPEFGYRFITDELYVAGHRASENRVWRLCGLQGVSSGIGRSPVAGR